jgi:hypothetical protein
MQVLIDHNLVGDAEVLFGLLLKDGWVELLDLQFVYFKDVGLSVESDDTTIWRFAQAQGMLLLTNNRNDDDETSLTATIRRENRLDSLPVLTVANPRRLEEPGYRREVAESLVEALFYLENFFGTGRLYLPPQVS